ncbi:MAG: hypothetical protein DHS20C11_36440 [Lysobacteraceae bacterium]|nr:MAG: hypothetical protein DHS20C11_36440 [Xanthomonadaceae bacterium]
MNQKTPFDDNIEVHFPITVMQRQYQGVDQMNRSLASLVSDLEEKYRDTNSNAVNEGSVSTQGGYQTSTKMNLFTVNDPAIAAFKEQLLLPAVNQYLSKVFGEESKTLNPWPVGWANVLRAGDWQGPHLHPTEKNIISGVYYVQLPGEKQKPEGWIEFINPQLISVNHGFPTTRRVEPVEGKLVLFPPFYMHYVHPFKGDGERTIIAFDVLAQKPGMQLVF